MTGAERERRNWVRPPWVVVVLPIVVIAALIPSAFYADERFKVYMHAVQYEGSLVAIIRKVFGDIGNFLELGNFRPLARIVDRFEHSVAFEVSTATSFPPHIAHGFFRVVGVVSLSVAAWWLVKLLERGTGSKGAGPATLLIPITLAGSLLGLTTQSPVVLFPFLYLMSSTIVLSVAALLIRRSNQGDDPMGWRAYVGYGALGLSLAAFNEITYLAIPISLVIVVVWWWIHQPGVAFMRLRALRAWAVMSGGFLVLFIPVRLMIASNCSDGACYAASDLSFNSEAIRLWFDRVVDSFFLLGWGRTYKVIMGEPSVPDVDILWTNWGMVALAAVVVAGAVVVSRALAVLPATPGWRLPVGLVAAGLGIIGIASVLAALSVRLQEIDTPLASPWRESALSIVGWAMIIAAVLLSLRRFAVFRDRMGAVIVAVGLSAFMVGTLYANTAAAARMRNIPESVLHNQVSANMVSFGRTDNAEALRCGLLAELRVIYEANGADATHTISWINQASELANGEPFCTDE